ncbi:glycosyltransferase family 4 protein [Candidatus Parcubacteria bacterium]|nr:glycosyltransferase family 4 protein [Candidatus Parcubacteria bacterium]
MKLLICTQKVDINDDLLGFFHSWIAEFAKNCEQVTVVCLYKGEYDLPENVDVLSLGKEKRNQESGIRNKGIAQLLNCLIVKLLYFFNFYKYIWHERKNYDSVFVHMNSVYVLLGGLFWRMWRKKIGLWYAHGYVPWELRVAEKFVDNIFTSTASGCRMKSDKIRIVGQGIDFNKFQINSKFKIQNSKFNLITIGRISPVKDIGILIKAVDVLVKKGINVKLDIIGKAGLVEQREYYKFLQELVKEKKLENNINFAGAVPNKNIAKHLQEADIFVSASQTGSLDKTFLEAMACGLPVIGCNEALLAVLGDYEKDLFYAIGDFNGLSERIKGVVDLSGDDYVRMGDDLRKVVVDRHGLENFIKKIMAILK